MKKIFGKILLYEKSISRVMKTYFFLFFFSLSKLFCSDIYSQNITISKQDVSLLTIIKELEHKSNYIFFYNNNLIDTSTKTSINIYEKSIDKILDKLFKNTKIKYLMRKKSIVLYLKSSTPHKQKHSSIPNEIINQIVDVSNEYPIPFSTIRFKNKNNGLIADENGYFRIPYIYKTQKDTLLISSIGYITKEIPVESLLDDKLNFIKLNPKIEALETVMLIAKKQKSDKYIPPLQFVEKAINKITKNYPIKPYSYIGYYRDYQLLNNQHINLNESIIKVFDEGFHTDKINHNNNQTALFNYIENSDFARDSILGIAYDNNYKKYIKDAKISPIGGNELNLLNASNAIRNFNKNSFSFVSIFKDHFIYNHEFRYGETHFLNDEPIYEITFKAKKRVSGKKHNASGSIFISPKNYAIYKLLYNTYRVNEETPIYSVKIEYAPKGDRMFINYISFNNLFEIKSNNNFIVKDVTFDKSKNSFFITFSNQVKEASIHKKNFKFIYQNKKLSISKIQLIDKNILKVNLVQGTIPNLKSIDDQKMDDFTYKIKKVKDIANRKLNKFTLVKVNQFRELFVQEVFPNTSLSRKYKLARKSLPLSMSPINILENKSKYWVNTPLKNTKK